MVKIFVASFNRASDGAISKLVKKMKEEYMLTEFHENADYILAVGDRVETFDFVLERFRENKKIIHLWAGEVSQGTHDEVYRHAITLMSCIQLCTNDKAKERVKELCRAVGKVYCAATVGNIMLDNIETRECFVPKNDYLLILYNPPTVLTKDEIYKEIEQIQYIINREGIEYVWVEPNGDKFSDIIYPYQTHSNLPREEFLGLMKNCKYFITNSSCQYYEGQFLLEPHQIISIGERNIERESKYSNMTIKNASENVMKVLRGIK